MRGVPQDPPHHADCRQGRSGAGSVQVTAENKEKGECFILLHIPEAQQRDRQWMINKCARASNQLIPLKIALSSVSLVKPPFPTPDVPSGHYLTWQVNKCLDFYKREDGMKRKAEMMKQKCVGNELPASTGSEGHQHPFSFFTDWTSCLLGLPR